METLKNTLSISRKHIHRYNCTGTLKNILYFLLLTFTLFSCSFAKGQITVGAAQLDNYLKLIKGKKVGLVVNQTSVIGQTHLVDTLKSLDIEVKFVFAPEHGFRGEAGAGEHIKSEIDPKTGIQVVSLYGKTKKPSAEILAQLDIVIFDIQDVGARFYTYISTLHYVIEACIENKKQLILLDRPNPNGMYVQGPVLEPQYKSFVGMHPIPILHGLTLGELTQMIIGENWVQNSNLLDYKIISCKNYTHQQAYQLAIRPSPNLPNQQAVMLYPSLCLFEATKVSVGRGTVFPFQVYGTHTSSFGNFQFTPKTIKGYVTHPPYEDTLCYGVDLRKVDIEDGFSLKFILDAYQKIGKEQAFIASPSFFDKLAGTNQLRLQLQAGVKEEEIVKSWQPALDNFKKIRTKYLIYP